METQFLDIFLPIFCVQYYRNEGMCVLFLKPLLYSLFYVVRLDEEILNGLA